MKTISNIFFVFTFSYIWESFFLLQKPYLCRHSSSPPVTLAFASVRGKRWCVFCEKDCVIWWVILPFSPFFAPAIPGLALQGEEGDVVAMKTYLLTLTSSFLVSSKIHFTCIFFTSLETSFIILNFYEKCYMFLYFSFDLQVTNLNVITFAPLILTKLRVSFCL